MYIAGLKISISRFNLSDLRTFEFLDGIFLEIKQAIT